LEGGAHVVVHRNAGMSENACLHTSLNVTAALSACQIPGLGEAAKGRQEEWDHTASTSPRARDQKDACAS
jgi:hypothetical protein